MKKDEAFLGLEWPYPVEYDQETRDEADVLVIGGGLSGGFAAIHAAKRGAKVIIVEKGATIRSGAAGSGIDHWSFCFSNPCCKVPKEVMVNTAGFLDPFGSMHTMYIAIKESYDALLDLEEWGVKVRDVDNEFVGAPFRDEATKLLFAYDYDNKYAIRFFGARLKKAMYNEMRKLGIKIYDRTMATSLLTKDGKVGTDVIGCTAINNRTGRFHVFSAKSTILATAKPLRLWDWGSETTGANAAHDDPNCAGDGDVMAYRAGAQLMTMERSVLTGGSLRYPPYGTGNSENTWYPCSMVDDEGKEIPWHDRDRNIVEGVDARNHCVPGQDWMLGGGMPGPYPIATPHLIFDLEERIMKNEFKQPFWADLTDMPWYERKVIFGLNVGNEGKTRIPVFKTLVDNGFDPSKDMLMANVTHPSIQGKGMPGWMAFGAGVTDSSKRETSFFNYGGLKVNWNLMTTLPGLFASGNNCAGTEGASTAAATGRYAGRQIANYAKNKTIIAPCEDQIAKEKERVYAPLKNEEGYGWREIQIGLCRIMQDYLGEFKEEHILNMGLWWMNSIRENEISKGKVDNPHELAKLLEVEVRLSAGELIMHNSLARKSSTQPFELDFKRIDYPEKIPPTKNCSWGIKRDVDTGEIVYEPIPFAFWNENGKSYEDNYLENRKWDEIADKTDKVRLEEKERAGGVN